MAVDTEVLREKIEGNENIELQISGEDPVQDLSDVIKVLLDKTSWIKTVSVENKAEEFERYRKQKKGYKPDFKFREYPYETQKLKDLINQCREETGKIDRSALEKHELGEIEPEQIQNLFKGVLDEIALYVKLAKGIENEEEWREVSEKIWPMVDSETAEKSVKYLKQNTPTEPEKNIEPCELAEMFREEVERLGMEYRVETEKVSGCYNSPENRKVVVAEGENGERKYSREEAQMLTVHEIFHAVRAYNGFSTKLQVLGLHTPFYDRTEEGGALYREKKTETMYGAKEFDYHLRLVAAFEIWRSDDFREEFTDMMDKLVALGASEKRAFNLLARNREALRHHIYLAGLHDWKEVEDKQKMLIGKVNEEWAEKLWREIDTPEIGEERLFKFTFKDSD